MKLIKVLFNYIKWSLRIWALSFLGIIILAGLYMFYNDSIYYRKNDEAIASLKKEGWGLQTISSNGKEVMNYARIRENSPNFDFWLFIPDTPVSLPVMYKTNDDMFYRTHDCYNETTPGGTPFVDPSCSADLDDQVSVIYGVDADGDRLFSCLFDYVYDKNFAKEHDTLTVVCKDSKRQYRFVAAYVDDSQEKLPTKFDSATAYAEFLNTAISKMEYRHASSIDMRKNSLILANCYPSGGIGRTYVVIFQPIS